MFFFFKQKTAYEMRISDWSSDVCSSDLYMAAFYGEQEVKEHFEGLSFGANTVRDGVNLSEHKKIESILRASDLMTLPKLQAYLKTPEIGSASCRESVCQYV